MNKYYLQKWGGAGYFLTTETEISTCDRFFYNDDIQRVIEAYDGELRDCANQTAFIMFEKEVDGQRFIDNEINPFILMKTMVGKRNGLL